MGGTILNAKRWHLSKDDTERKERIDTANRISNAVAAGVTLVHFGSERTSRAKMCSERAQLCNRHCLHQFSNQGFSFQCWRISHTETIRALTEARGVSDLKWQQLSKAVLTLLWAARSELLCQPWDQFTLPRLGFSSGTSYSIGLTSVPIICSHDVPFLSANTHCGARHG